jgi:hypothetical protein
MSVTHEDVEMYGASWDVALVERDQGLFYRWYKCYNGFVWMVESVMQLLRAGEM